jgi:hypothetical protein
VGLIAAAVGAAERNKPLPEDFPRSCLPVLTDWGRDLGPEDTIMIREARTRKVARYTRKGRRRLTAFVPSAYTDTHVTVSGKVLAADVRHGRLQIYPPGDPPVQAHFTEAQEEQVIRALKEHKSKVLVVRGRGEFYPDGKLKEISEIAELRLLPEGVSGSLGPRTIAEELLALAEDVPDDALEALPTDGSERLDDYIYGERED